MRSLYIHVPFCDRKCFYCSFIVSIGQRPLFNSYIDALTKEARQYKGATIETIYIGGGTPTLLERVQMEKLFVMIRENFHFSDGIEWTMEANPEGMNARKARWLKEMGVNRISLGVQTLNEKYLTYLGRNHNRQKALEAFDGTREAGFKNINVDMMFGFADQTSDELRKDLEEITRFNSEHISVYSLSVEENSRFYAKKISLPDDPIQTDQCLLVMKTLEEKGFAQYEISNFSKPGKMSQHNRNYWTGGEYIGLGVGAHSHIHGKRFWNVPRLNKYMAHIQEKGSAVESFELLTGEQRMIETLLFGLRMNAGVDLNKLEQRFHWSLDGERRRRVNAFVQEGLLVWDGAVLKTTQQGRLLLDELCARLI
ncbi:MAG TPA: coproporphyrinogen III oxidase [Candidatus Omnitrophica bacterium]|nr:MAG: hypothetical protein A2Z81_01635 [Omnitrophica WOR_2 bacterium GWA2_45_18]OGX18509.1 MAG: hypothetical protein A2Y04_03420 [Omnitrophica WOR_2 bacterium GWC2_45_7]HBR14425.1 coproporphyrinogen III oxidase [Candidatus Omnitrophota bacterium]